MTLPDSNPAFQHARDGCSHADVIDAPFQYAKDGCIHTDVTDAPSQYAKYGFRKPRGRHRGAIKIRYRWPQNATQMAQTQF